MKIAVLGETLVGERRVALVPESVGKLIKAGMTVGVEAGAGDAAGFADEAFTAAGARVTADPDALVADADVVLKVNAPATGEDGRRNEAAQLRSGTVLVCNLVPARHQAAVRALAERGVTAYATDLIPRITRAQSMDTLSSMANIAGYKAVLIAANALTRYFPMLMTAAGTVLPARVFVIGAGVAGLQAIATARRLGANVEATDTRPAVKEQVESLGAKFVGAETGAEAQDAGGYAKELSPEFYRRQGELIAERCAAADVVITTALIGGIKAPRLISAAMVAAMKPGAVIVDLAAEAGGNCELTRPGETTVVGGVTICAPLDLPSQLAWHASTLFSRNLVAFVTAFYRDGRFVVDREDEIQRGAMVTHAGEVLYRGPVV